jgi:hypothetical protein
MTYREHLYRNHKALPYCKRCWKVFETEELLDSHATVPASSICEVLPGNPPEGITPKQMLELKSKAKPYSNQNEADRWKKIFRLLFPDESVPSPCKLNDVETRSAGSGKLMVEQTGSQFKNTHLLHRTPRFWRITTIICTANYLIFSDQESKRLFVEKYSPLRRRFLGIWIWWALFGNVRINCHPCIERHTGCNNNQKYHQGNLNGVRRAL